VSNIKEVKILAEIPIPEHTEVWYEIQYSPKGENDWFASGMAARSDTIEGARKQLRYCQAKWLHDYRIVKKTLTEEVVL
jgi:hypothetical protein